MVLPWLEYKLQEGRTFGYLLVISFNSAWHVVINIFVAYSLWLDIIPEICYLSPGLFLSFARAVWRLGFGIIPFLCVVEKFESWGVTQWIGFVFIHVQVLKGTQMSSDKQQYLFCILYTPFTGCQACCWCHPSCLFLRSPG